MHNLVLGMVSIATALNMHAQEKVVRLYDAPAPGSETWKHQEKESLTNMWRTRVVFNVADPTLTLMLPDSSVACGTAVVICPGGAFHALLIDSEGLDVGRWLNKKGGHGFGMRSQNLPTDHWIDRCAEWLDLQGLLKK